MKADKLDMAQYRWKPIKGLENYLISDTGIVYNRLTNHVIKPVRQYINGSLSRYKCSLSHVNSKGKNSPITKFIDYLVATAFVDNPNNYRYVSHLDGDIYNNDANNLVWSNYRQANANNNAFYAVDYLDSNGEQLPVYQVRIFPNIISLSSYYHQDYHQTANHIYTLGNFCTTDNKQTIAFSAELRNKVDVYRLNMMIARANHNLFSTPLLIGKSYQVTNMLNHKVIKKGLVTDEVK